MEETVVAPPPLPPKTKKTPPPSPESSATVSTNSIGPAAAVADVFECGGTPQVQPKDHHVVKIVINPTKNETTINNKSALTERNNNNNSELLSEPCIRISVNSDSEMIQNNSTMGDTSHERSNPYFYYSPYNNCGIMSSGQVSPSDTLDSGTCSDLDGTPPPLPKKKNAGVSVTLIGGHKRAPSLASSGAEVDSDDNESNLSCDSLNSGKISPVNNNSSDNNNKATSHLPLTLLQDIRQRNVKLLPPVENNNSHIVVDEKPYVDRRVQELPQKATVNYESDMYYKFHLNEHVQDNCAPALKAVVEDETFAGYKDLLSDGASTIRSAKGTVRGVKNRVRAGIATFLQYNSTLKNYKEKDAGKVVVYTTTMGILRETYQACMKVKQILRTLLVKFEERDVFMSSEYQAEIQERMRCDQILVPQVFVDGQHVGDAETIERLNESGELRRILKPFKSMDACSPCKACGGYRLLPCPACKGSKKSVHRNHFTAEFVALKCMNCDEVGLVRCSSC